MEMFLAIVAVIFSGIAIIKSGKTVEKPKIVNKRSYEGDEALERVNELYDCLDLEYRCGAIPRKEVDSNE